MKTFRRKSDSGVVAGLIALAAAMLCGPVRADIVGTSSIQFLFVSTPFDYDDFFIIAYPPVSVSLHAASDGNVADASQTISTYIGPLFAGDIVPFLSLSGGSSASHVQPVSSVFSADAASNFVYDFALDGIHAYTFSFSEFFEGAGGSGVTLVGPGGPVAAGNGSLSAGSYQLTVNSATSPFVSTGSASNTFSLEVSAAVTAVPEARAWLMMGLAAVGGCGYQWFRWRQRQAAA